MDPSPSAPSGFGLPTAATVVVLAVAVAFFRGGGAAAAPPVLPAPVAVVASDSAKPRVPSPAAAAPSRFQQGEALLREFFGDSLPKALCVRGEECYRLDALVATVPDPAETRLDANYDAAMESLRRAHETAGFVIDRFWLPPTGDITIAAAKHPRRRVEPGVLLFRHRDAGERRLRLLYLVGEVPTAGVHRRALANALDERARLTEMAKLHDDPPRVVRVVGPMFSGSAPSLRRGLDAWLDEGDSTAQGAEQTSRGWSVAVVSGSATSPENVTTLTRPDGRITFHHAVNTDASLDAALAGLLRRLEIDSSRVAVLREGTTQYGGSLAAAGAPSGGRSSRGFVDIPFPMSISALRRETQGAPAAPAPDPRFPGGEAAESQVAMSLRDSARSLESPRTVSDLTPAATEVVLDEIIATLRRHDIRLVGLQGTDVRDKLFLAEQIRRQMRGVQFFTYESNALYLRSDRNASLRGMLVLSSYPLVLENQWWTGSTGERLVFPSDAAQGTYNATLQQLGAEAGRLELQRPFSAGAAPPGPPVWISVVGSRRFLPLAVDLEGRSGPQRDDEADPSATRQATSPVVVGGALLAALGMVAAAVAAFRSARERGEDRATPPVPRRRPAPAARRVMAFAGESEGLGAGGGLPSQDEEREGIGGAGPPPRRTFFAGVMRFVGTVGQDRRGPPATLRVALSPSAEQRRTVHAGSLLLHRQIYTGMRLLALAGGAAPVFLLLLRQAGGSSPGLTIAAALAAVAWLAGMGFAVHAAAGVLRRYARVGLAYTLRKGWWRGLAGWLWMAETLGRTGVVAVGVVFVGLVLWLLWELPGPGAPDAAPFALFMHRALELGGGASPLVPILAATAGCVLWASWHLQRIALLMRPTAFEYACVTRADRGARRDAPCPEDRIARAVADLRDRLFLMVPHPRALWLAGALSVLILWLVPQFAPTLEAVVLRSTLGSWLGTTSFDVLLRFSVCATLVATAWAVYRMLVIWHALQRVLTTVEETPLTDALDRKRLPPYVARLTRLSLLGTPRYAVDALVAGRLNRLRMLYREHKLPIEEAIKRGAESSLRLKATSDAVLSREEADRDALMKGDAVWNGRACLWSRAHPGEQFLSICSAMEHLWAHRSDDQALPADAEKAKRVQQWSEAAEDFVAAQLVDYLDVVLQQFRRLAIFLFVSLLLTTLLVSGYPFHPQSLVKLVFLGVLAATVGSLLLVMTQMNTDATLSRIAGTDAGRITWDTPFVLNTLMVAVVPLLTLLSSEYPALRGFVFAWVGPLFSSLGGG